MSEFFREVDEELRRKQMKRFWDRYGYALVGAAVLVVLLTAGYKGWEAYQDSARAAQGDQFLEALRLSDEGNSEEARTALDALASGGSGGYELLARFRAASDKAASGDPAGAIADFDVLSRNADIGTFLQDMARIRAGYLAVDIEDFDSVQQRIADLDATGHPLRFSAREILGLSAWRAEKLDDARKHFQALREDSGTPPDLRQRAEFMLALLTSRLGADDADETGSATQTQ